MKATPAETGMHMALGSWKCQFLKLKVLILVTLTFFMYHKWMNKIKFKSRNDSVII